MCDYTIIHMESDILASLPFDFFNSVGFSRRRYFLLERVSDF
jgi:hypothetical protein